MQIYDFIRQRMKNMGYDPDQVVIEPYVQLFDGDMTIIEASNVYYYLYEVTEYTHIWKIESDTEIISNHKFILQQKIPSGILELTGNIEITSPFHHENIFMFYRATPGGMLPPLPPAPIPDPDPYVIAPVPQNLQI